MVFPVYMVAGAKQSSACSPFERRRADSGMLSATSMVWHCAASFPEDSLVQGLVPFGLRSHSPFGDEMVRMAPDFRCEDTCVVFNGLHTPPGICFTQHEYYTMYMAAADLAA